MAVGDDEMIDTSFAPNHTSFCLLLSRPKKKDDDNGEFYTYTHGHQTRTFPSSSVSFFNSFHLFLRLGVGC